MLEYTTYKDVINKYKENINQLNGSDLYLHVKENKRFKESETIIFLDIDGVLNGSGNPLHFIQDTLYKEFIKKYDKKFWVDVIPEHLYSLSVISKTLKADIVISSTWRFRGADKIRVLFNDIYGYDFNILGITPRRYTLDVPEDFCCRRGDEIRLWLDLYPQYKDKKILILDDDTDMKEYIKYLYKTNVYVGLNCDLIQDVLRFMGITKIPKFDYKEIKYFK